MAEILDIAQLVRKLALIEEEGVAFYQSLAEHTGNDKIRKLARLMARAEQVHQRGFEKLSLTIGKRPKGKPSDKITAGFKQYVLGLIDHRIFLSPDQASRLAKNVTDLKEAVDVAIRFEKENILLLHECKEVVGGSTKKLIQGIIEEEKRHIVGLQKAGAYLAKMR